MAVGFDNSPIGSVGHLVGAALETAGQFVQSSMLDVMQVGLGQALGTLLFCIVVASGMLVFVITGKRSAWAPFFVGVPLFFAVTTFRIESSGVQWQFGQRVYPDQYVADASVGAASGLPGVSGQTPQRKAKVAWLYAVYDRLVSTLIQTVIATLEPANRKSDLTFIAKGDRYLALFNLEARDWKIKYFMNLTAVNKCSDYYLRLRDFHDATIDARQQAVIKDELVKKGSVPAATGSDFHEFFTWLQQVGWWDEVRPLLGNRANLPVDDIQLTCDELWTVAVTVFKSHAVELIDEVASIRRPPGLSTDDTLNQLKEKFATTTYHPEAVTAKLDDTTAFISMVNEVSARMFLHELKNVSPNLAQLEYGQNAVIGHGGAVTNPSEATKAMRALQRTDEYEEKADYLMAMLALPYVQGMMLYFLSVTYPIFALCLIVPGRHGAFLLWFGLWMWVKLWDLGFAIVMLIDNMLYQLLPHGRSIADVTLRDPGATIKSLLEVDPTYSVHTYYNLLATCMAAVPIATAFLVKKGGSDFVGMAGNITQFSGRIGGAMASFQRSLRAQTLISKQNQNLEKALERGLVAALKDPIIQTAATGKVIDMAAAGVANARSFGMAKNFTPFLRSLAGASVEQRQNFISARLNQLVWTEVMNETYSERNLLLVEEANRQKYYAHDFTPMYIGDALLGWEKAAATFPLAGSSGAFVSGGINSVIGISGSLPPGLAAAPAAALMGIITSDRAPDRTPGGTDAAGNPIPVK